MRLLVDEFYALDIVHAASELESGAGGRAGAAAPVFGTTEWTSVGADRPSLNFAWDWIYDLRTQRIEAQWSTLRSNVRLFDTDGSDLGEQGLRLCLAIYMTRLRWECVVAGRLGLSLAAPLPKN